MLTIACGKAVSHSSDLIYKTAKKSDAHHDIIDIDLDSLYSINIIYDIKTV